MAVLTPFVVGMVVGVGAKWGYDRYWPENGLSFGRSKQKETESDESSAEPVIVTSDTARAVDADPVAPASGAAED